MNAPTLTGCLRMLAGLTVRKYSREAHADSTWLVGHSSGTAPPLADRFVGCLLGLAVGDSLGSPLEGWAAPEIAILHPTGIRQLSARNDLKYRPCARPHVRACPRAARSECAGDLIESTIILLRVLFSLVLPAILPCHQICESGAASRTLDRSLFDGPGGRREYRGNARVGALAQLIREQ